jgi:hypothetical protein
MAAMDETTDRDTTDRDTTDRDTTDRTDTPGPRDIRASDAEREETAARIREAAAEGRLDLAELEQRLASVYAARLRHELAPLVADLPAPPEETPPARAFGRGAPRRLDVWDRTALGLHAALVVAVAVTAISHAVTAQVAGIGAGHPWPAVPIVWALITLAVHARLRLYGTRSRPRTR